MSDSIQREEQGAVTIVRLAHGKASALDVELCDAIHQTFTDLRDCEAVVLTGTGKIFSAGVDLLRLLDGGVDYTRQFLPALRRCLMTLFSFPRPLVAAANGHAIAGGCVLVATCDYRVMAAGTARIGVPELLVGVPFPTLALEAMRFAVPPQHFQEVIYRGASFVPGEALSRGLVDEVIDPEQCLQHAVDVASGMAAIPRRSFELAKQQVRQPTHDLLQRHEEAVDRDVVEAWCSDEIRSKIRSYMDAVAARKK